MKKAKEKISGDILYLLIVFCCTDSDKNKMTNTFASRRLKIGF